MHDTLDDATISALVGTNEQFFSDLFANKSRLVVVIDPNVSKMAIFGLQCVASGHGGFKVRHRDGRHIGSFADLGAALTAAVAATGLVPA